MFVKSNRGWLVLAYISISNPIIGGHFDEYLGLKDTRDNRREAERIKRSLEAARLNGTFEREFARRFPASKNLPQFSVPTKEPTLGEFAVGWLREQAHLTDATRNHYRLTLKNHLLGYPIANKRLAEVNDGDVTLLVGALQERFVSASRRPGIRALNMVIARLRTIFATAKRRKLIADDPMQFVRNLRQPKSEVDPFDLDEARALVEAAEGWERSFITVLIFTGMRPNEALALHWSQIDWAHDLIRVRRNIRAGQLGLPKTASSERDAEMIGFVRKALQEQRSRSQLKGELVFPSANGTLVDLNNFRARSWPRILRRAAVRPRTIYQCRHTFARLAIEQGDTPQHVAAQLGHANLRMVFEVYGRWLKRPASAALDALDRAVSITQPSPKSGGESAGSTGKE